MINTNVSEACIRYFNQINYEENKNTLQRVVCVCPNGGVKQIFPVPGHGAVVPSIVCEMKKTRGKENSSNCHDVVVLKRYFYNIIIFFSFASAEKKLVKKVFFFLN